MYPSSATWGVGSALATPVTCERDCAGERAEQHSTSANDAARHSAIALL